MTEITILKIEVYENNSCMFTQNSFKYIFIICREDKPGWVWSEFQETVPMSTYLVAFMVSEFDFRQSDPELNNVVLRVWARQEAIDQVQLYILFR